MSTVTMKELLEAGVHFGHETKRWDPKNETLYLWGKERDLHYRSPEDGSALQGGLSVRSGSRPQRENIFSLSERRNRPRNRSPKRRPAVGCSMSTTAGWEEC